MEYWPVNLTYRPKVHTMLASADHGIDGRIERYRLDLWCLRVFRSEAVLLLDGERYRVLPRHACVVAPGVGQEHRFQKTSEHVLARFSLPADATLQCESMLPVPVVVDLGDAFERTWTGFQNAIGTSRSWPERGDAFVWQLLWSLVELGGGETHPGVDLARLEQRSA